MRVIWKDSVNSKETRKYRRHTLLRQRHGWSIDIPGDNNIYAAIRDAYNAIDKELGVRKNKERTLSGENRIKIIGKLNA